MMSSFEHRTPPPAPAEFTGFSADALGSKGAAKENALFPEFNAAVGESAPVEVAVDEPSAEDYESLAAALQAAREEGRMAGRSEAAEALRSHEDALVSSLREWEQARSLLVEEHRGAILDFSLEVAEKIVGEALDADPMRWTKIIRDGLAQVLGKERILLRCHPALHAKLSPRVEALHAGVGDALSLEMVEDGTLPDGGCVLEAGVAELDLGIHSQIQSLRQSLQVRADR